jgi:DNA topoisomerase VI subunit B
MPKLNDDIGEVLKPHFTEFEIELINTMVETTCQSKTAELLNHKYKLSGDNKMTQVKIRHKFERFIERLKKYKKGNNDLATSFKLLSYVRDNLYMMHEVVLPHFDRGYRVRIKEIC